MEIEIEPNPNCGATDQFVYQEIEAPTAIEGVRITLSKREARVEGVSGLAGADEICDVVAV